MAHLPVTDPDVIQEFSQQYEAASRAGGKDALDCCFRLVWALVHSRSTKDVKRGLRLAETMLDGQVTDEQMQRDLVYLCAVAKFKSGSYIDCRRQLDELLKVQPESRQAKDLKQSVEDQIVKEGLIGVGIGAGVIGVAAVVLSAFLKR